MNKWLCLLLLFFMSTTGFAQQRKGIFLEVGGSAGLGSINYERNFLDREQLDLNWRVGFSFVPIDRNNGTNLIFPVLVHALIGPQAHKLELALGQGISLTTKGSFFAVTTPVVGYRLQKEDRPWYFRAVYTPLVSYIIDFQWQHWGGLSIGYQFN